MIILYFLKKRKNYTFSEKKMTNKLRTNINLLYILFSFILLLIYYMEYKINLSSYINLFNSHTRYDLCCLYFINKYLIKLYFHAKHFSIDILKRVNIVFKNCISKFKLNLITKTRT